MRRLIPLALFLTACSPLATPAPYAAAPARLQVTDAPDLRATQYAIDAQVRLEAERTETAQAFAIATRTQVAGETQAAGTAMYAAAGATGTAVAYSVTLQAVAGAQATGTYWAGAATQTATAAGPSMTATRAAQVVVAERETFSAWAWLIAFVIAFFAIVGGAVFAGVRWADAQGAERKARAAAGLREAQARAYSLEMAAMAQATKIHIEGRMMLVIVSGQITAARRLAEPTGEMRLIEQPPNVPGGNVSMVQFVKDAQRAAGVSVATFIPSNDRMGWASTSAWQAHVDALKALKIAYTDGTGRPAAGAYRTKLADGWTLNALLEKLENGQLIIPTGD